MNDVKRGDDAADHAPKPDDKRTPTDKSSEKQDAPNYKTAVDGGRAEPVDGMNSANDE
ncbi:hypothetical protein [Beijerinckia sp. L45]|uniref:hypothetical protein n=1 Tax=Beijerinckia sp. L45 TaxID=1641855 RepID=UPI00131B0248|nr:hypothetical protein [Beijerinckia sp. L45]